MKNDVAVLIPARYSSSRLPGKPLELLNGIPMIRRVALAAAESKLPVFILTDKEWIADAAGREFFSVIDDAPFKNGTERCASVLQNPYFDNYNFFINVQGDMPDVNASMIHSLLEAMYKPQCFVSNNIVTAYTELKPRDVYDINSVKAIICQDELRWCGRGLKYGHHHLGLYGYTRNALHHYPRNQSKYEILENGLEQLRWLEAGHHIGAVKVDFDGAEINTREDVNKWHEIHAND